MRRWRDPSRLNHVNVAPAKEEKRLWASICVFLPLGLPLMKAIHFKLLLCVYVCVYPVLLIAMDAPEHGFICASEFANTHMQYVWQMGDCVMFSGLCLRESEVEWSELSFTGETTMMQSPPLSYSTHLRKQSSSKNVRYSEFRVLLFDWKHLQFNSIPFSSTQVRSGQSNDVSVGRLWVFPNQHAKCELRPGSLWCLSSP